VKRTALKYLMHLNEKSRDMANRQPRYTKEEHARLGNAIYERSVKTAIDEEVEYGRIVAIDIDSEAFELADDVLAASEKLIERHPDAQTWFVRVGHPSVHHFGPHTLSNIG
jgi:hypothetical protein